MVLWEGLRNGAGFFGFVVVPDCRPSVALGIYF